MGALTFGLTRGGDWGWGSDRTIVVLAASAVLLISFVLHCAHARNPLIEPALFRGRSYVGATAVMFLFSMAFGAMLLSIVLWLQDDWGWSALRAGLGVAPGPIMVTLFSFLIAGAPHRPLRPGRGGHRRVRRAGRRGHLVGPGHRRARRLPGRRPRRHAAHRRASG